MQRLVSGRGRSLIAVADGYCGYLELLRSGRSPEQALEQAEQARAALRARLEAAGEPWFEPVEEAQR